MYPEITSHLNAAQNTLEGHYFVDRHAEKILLSLIKSVEFLAQKVWAMDQQRPAANRGPYAPDPHRHLEGNDD
jgi:hypothetical protein